MGIGLLAACASTRDLAAPTRAPTLPGFGAPELQSSTANAEARRLFTQGMAQAYAFNAPEAVRAFKAALAADPRCTLCAWGVAWQLGPNINSPGRDSMGDAVREAQRYVTLAQRHAGRATALEQALLDAMASRYGSPAAGLNPVTDGPPGAEICGSARRAPGRDAAHPLDVAYAERLRALADALPEDADIVSLYAEAEMVATHDDWWHPKTGQPAGRIGELAQRLERALQAQPGHTGLNHYLVHALDSSTQAARAAMAADRLGALAPASPHLLHMPSHIYVKVGRFDDAVRVNQQALAAEVALTATLKDQALEPVWNWDRHNQHFLWFAALMRDDAELALATARRIAESAAAGTGPYAEYRRALPLLTLARLQRWDALRAEAPVSGSHGLGPAISDALQGLALAHGGQLPAAQARAAALQKAVDAANARAGRGTETDPVASPLVLTLQAWLQAELALRQGQPDAALAALKRAIASEDELGGEPPVLGAASRAALGDVLLRQRRWPEAEAAFRDDLRLHPANAFGQRGLAQALQGRQQAARRNLRGPPA